MPLIPGQPLGIIVLDDAGLFQVVVEPLAEAGLPAAGDDGLEPVGVGCAPVTELGGAAAAVDIVGFVRLSTEAMFEVTVTF